MERVILFGGCGSGKTTLALALSQKTGLPVCHLDQLYWHGHWQESDREIFDQKINEALAQPRFIMDGNYNRTLAQRIARADTVIYLDYSRLTCLLGVLGRTMKNWGRTRPDMGGDCPERLDFSFLRFTWTFNDKHRADYLAMMRSLTNKETHIFRNRRQARQWLAGL